MHEVLVNRLGGLSLPRKSVVRLTDRPEMTLDVYRGCKTTIQPTNQCTDMSKTRFHETIVKKSGREMSSKNRHEENYLGTSKDIVSRTVQLNTEKLYIYNLQ